MNALADLPPQAVRAAMVAVAMNELAACSLSPTAAAAPATKMRRATSTSGTAPSRRCSTSTSTSREREVTALIGPSGCGKSTFLRCLNRMNDTIDGCRVEGDIRARRPRRLRRRRRRRAAARPGRHGVPEAQPVPEVDLRQRRLRPAHPRPRPRQGRDGRDRRGGLARRRPVGRGRGPARPARQQPLRRPAAAPVHRARDRGRARR